ncbi:hypothetical protein [Pseudoalteromonas luteoviolacea]|uniref:hypothetical protein n=1 Tax=Pseudoalteromonas luteoviolacea TaxID=43657 RepID=UPI00186B6124|nr:hypothetical protein [Pseudoalteromonas luteoviolacea]
MGEAELKCIVRARIPINCMGFLQQGQMSFAFFLGSALIAGKVRVLRVLVLLSRYAKDMLPSMSLSMSLSGNTPIIK